MSGIIQRWAVVCFFIAALAMVVRVGDEPAPERLNLVAAGACNPGGGTTTTQSTTSSSSTTAATTTGGATTTASGSTTTGGSTTTRPPTTTSRATTTTGGGPTLPITITPGATTSTSSTTTTTGGATTTAATTTTGSSGPTLPITILVPRAAGGNAAAAAGECASNINAKYANGAFSGKVTSKSAKCERGRKVEIEKGNRVVGVKETNRQGKFKFTYPKKQAEGKTFEVRIFKERRGDVRCGAAMDKVKP